MSRLKYDIIENPNYTSCSKVGLEIFPENEPLMFFFSGLKKENFPHFLLELIENRSFGVENAWFTYYWEMDGGFLIDFKNKFGREMQENEIEIQVYDGKRKYSVMKKHDFEQIFYDYSKKLLEVYQSDSSLPETWKNEMVISLEKLKSKINHDSIT